jgi:hypothetical protein
MPALLGKIKNARHVILESNSVLQFVRPDLYLTVLDPATADFKNSAREFLDRADAVILHNGSEMETSWQGVSLNPNDQRRVFTIHPPNYVTPQIVDFVRDTLAAKIAGN